MKKPWDKPKLLVIQRGTLGENVLKKCDNTVSQGGPILCCRVVGGRIRINEYGPS